MTETGIDFAVGMQVVAPDGTELGIVRSVDHGLAYIGPDPGISDTLMAKFGWGGADRHSYPLDSRKIDTITADHVRLQELPDFVADWPTLIAPLAVQRVPWTDHSHTSIAALGNEIQTGCVAPPHVGVTAVQAFDQESGLDIRILLFVDIGYMGM